MFNQLRNCAAESSGAHVLSDLPIRQNDFYLIFGFNLVKQQEIGSSGRVRECLKGEAVQDFSEDRHKRRIFSFSGHPYLPVR